MSRQLRDVLKTANEAQKRYNVFTSLRTEQKISNLGLSEPTSSQLQGTYAAIKDNITTVGEPTTCSSRMLESYESPFEATVVRLLQNAGATIIGKTNMDEFGMGSGTTNSHFGTTLNPLYTEENRIVGGSSGGSAAAVAAGCVDYSLGTDTGGSVRLPAAYSGVIGYKPSYGRLSRWGVVAYAQSLDTVGILSKNIDFVEKVYNVLEEYDEKDPTSLSVENREHIASLQPQSKPYLRIGILSELVLNNLSTEVLNGLREVLELLSNDHQIVPVSIPNLKYALPTYYTLAPAEASSNLARYDGIRYGFRSDDDKNNYAKTRSLAFGEEVQNRIVLGNYNLNADSYKNHFLKAENQRQILRYKFDQIFKFQNVSTGNEGNPNGVDILLSPTALSTAPKIEQFNSRSSTEVFINDILTVPASLSGIPAISVPWTPSGSEEPIGIQLMAQYGDDSGLLKAAKLLLSLSKHS